MPKIILKDINYNTTTEKCISVTGNTQVLPQEHLTWHNEDRTKDLFPILHLFFYIKLLIIVLTWPAIQYPIKVSSILGIWTTNCLIPPTDAELMGGNRCTREGYEPLCLRAFPKENLILAHYMLST